MRKVTVNFTAKVILDMDDDAVIFDALSELLGDMTSGDGDYDVEDTELLDYEIVDSK